MQHAALSSLQLYLPGEEKEILVEHDDGIRPDISAAALGKLKAVFKKDGTTTAGNSSQVQLPAACARVYALAVMLSKVTFVTSACVILS